MPKEIFEVVRERFHLSDRTQYIVLSLIHI